MFAKLFETTHGQFLLTTSTEDDTAAPMITARFHVASPIAGATAVVEKSGHFEATDEGEEARDKAFDEFDREQAQSMADKGL